MCNSKPPNTMVSGPPQRLQATSISKTNLRSTITVTTILIGRQFCLLSALSFASPSFANIAGLGSSRSPSALTHLRMADGSRSDDVQQPRRGTFILLEGVDRCGKTTQANLLVEGLKQAGHDAHFMRFPDRTTPIGQMINAFLQNTTDIDDRCVHLLFSANRWEAESKIRERLKAGISVVCDRYAYSGVAFSASKPGLEVGWCKDPDRGLPAPDIILFLDISVEDAMKRGQFGEERYEKADFQRTVRSKFLTLMKDDQANGVHWEKIDATRSIESIQDEIKSIVISAIQRVEGKDISPLWPIPEKK